jgi:hypothetical protein
MRCIPFVAIWAEQQSLACSDREVLMPAVAFLCGAIQIIEADWFLSKPLTWNSKPYTSYENQYTKHNRFTSASDPWNYCFQSASA